MDRKTVAEELGQPGAQQMLRDHSLISLAYIGEDGFPRVVPIGFRWDGRRIVMTTNPTAPKFRALTARPQVALSLDTSEATSSNLNPASRSVQLRGVAEIDVSDAAMDYYIEGSVRSLEGKERAEAEASLRAFHRRIALISVEPTWARFYDFGAGRVPGFLARLGEAGR